eukprot:scaffold1909_cov353-Prasinococcus_capsulatus_cf.AAC.5
MSSIHPSVRPSGQQPVVLACVRPPVGRASPRPAVVEPPLGADRRAAAGRLGARQAGRVTHAPTQAPGRAGERTSSRPRRERE